jgi:hypothetical protein
MSVAFYLFYLKPYNLAVSYCEEQYKYHPATEETGAYHTALGFAGPITKYDSREEAIKMCAKFHRGFSDVIENL